jgi:solute carrier family 25 (mitochondrial oxoglutarate transporter), member 11
MTTDGRLPIEQRKHYKHVFDCLGRVIKEEGFFSMWR